MSTSEPLEDREDPGQSQNPIFERHKINGLGLDTRADTIDGLTAVLGKTGVKRIAWYGVRLFTDSWTPAHLGAGAEEQALEVELQASRRDPYRLMSRLFHIIGRRLSSH